MKRGEGRDKSWWGGSCLIFDMIGGGSLWKYKMTGGGLNFCYHKELHKGREIIVILNLLQWIFGFPFFNKVGLQDNLCVRFLIINITNNQH